METVLVSIKLMLWCSFGLLVMMCGWFTTLELLGKELCLGEGLSPNALSSCLFCSGAAGFFSPIGFACWYAGMDCVFWHLCIGLCSSCDLCLLGLQKLMLWVDCQGCLCMLLSVALLGLRLFG
jgi:hypothetical protein